MIPDVRLSSAGRVRGLVWVETKIGDHWRIVRGAPVGRVFDDGGPTVTELIGLWAWVMWFRIAMRSRR